MQFKSIVIDGVKIFYREAGEQAAPRLVLLHGYPASSHQYRNLIPALADQFHVIAPDYPAFGNSDLPDPASFDYTFGRLSAIMESFLAALELTRFGLYVQDYGGPIGLRIVGRRPEWLEWLIVQNANAYEVGLSPAWEPLRAYWRRRAPETEAPVASFLEPDTIREVYLHGHRRPELISPDTWQMDAHFMNRPNMRRAQLALLYDYRNNVQLYPDWQAWLRERQPRTIIFWGQHDIFFTREGGEAYLADLPRAELHRLDSGHFVLEDSLAYVADRMKAFYQREVR